MRVPPAVDFPSLPYLASLTADDVWQWLRDHVLTQAASILLILVIGFFFRWLLHRLIGRLVVRAETGVLGGAFSKVTLGQGESAHPIVAPEANARRSQRAQAMGSLLKSIVSGLVGGVVFVMVLSEVDIDIAPIIASAGIVGVALGFGAQSLVKDFISGVFMIFEDQYGVGDVVDLGEASGTVEAVSLRVTRLRDVNGTVWYVRNGEILRVGNQSQNWARTVLDIGVGYGEDLARVRAVLQEVAHDLWIDEDFTGVIIEEPEVWGVEDLAADAVTMRVTLKTAPLEQWRVAREMRGRIKSRFDYEGIEIPFPQRVVWQRAAPAPAEATTEAPDAAVEGQA